VLTLTVAAPVEGTETGAVPTASDGGRTYFHTGGQLHLI